MAGFVLSGLCSLRLLYMELKPLCWLLIAYASFGPLSIGFVWSRRQPLAGVGAVLSLLDLPTGCDPAFCVVWFRFRLLRRYLALWPMEVGRVYRLLEMVSEVLVTVLCIFLLPVLLRLVLGGIFLH